PGGRGTSPAGPGAGCAVGCAGSAWAHRSRCLPDNDGEPPRRKSRVVRRKGTMADTDFTSLFELLTIGAYRTDAASRHFRANRAMVRIFGFDSEAEMLAHPRSRAE